MKVLVSDVDGQIIHHATADVAAKKYKKLIRDYETNHMHVILNTKKKASSKFQKDW